MKKVNIYIVKLEHTNECPDELLSAHSDKSEAIKYASELINILWSEKTPSIRIDKQIIAEGGYYAFKPTLRITKSEITKIKKNNNERNEKETWISGRISILGD